MPAIRPPKSLSKKWRNAKANDNGLPNQLLKMNIKPIKLIKTIWPACMFAYKRINSEKGLMIKSQYFYGNQNNI